MTEREGGEGGHGEVRYDGHVPGNVVHDRVREPRGPARGAHETPRLAQKPHGQTHDRHRHHVLLEGAVERHHGHGRPDRRGVNRGGAGQRGHERLHRPLREGRLGRVLALREGAGLGDERRVREEAVAEEDEVHDHQEDGQPRPEGLRRRRRAAGRKGADPRRLGPRAVAGRGEVRGLDVQQGVEHGEERDARRKRAELRLHGLDEAVELG